MKVQLLLTHNGMQLPLNKDLPIKLLAACFNNTSATYKYYWFLSILNSIESGKTRIPKRELFAQMLSNAWYTVNYFRLSFGVQDRLQRAIINIKNSEKITIDERRERIVSFLIKTKNRDTIDQLKYFNNQVPHWFLSPWFPQMGKLKIYESSKIFLNQCLYALSDDEIEINPKWVGYLFNNIRLLKDFCYWNLSIFLQAKNPNVPDIPNKLIKPATRNSLTNQRRNFWDLVLKELGSVDCIYTGKRLTYGDYAVEHFIPYSFVSHDLIWNLIPADKCFNSSKGNRLPPLEKYFRPFYLLQRSAMDIIRVKTPNNKLLEDYLSLFPNLDEIGQLTEQVTMEHFKRRFEPLITIASNNGFEFMK